MADPHQGERTGGQQSPKAKISQGAVALFRQYAGRGPTQAHTTIRGDLAIIVLRETLTEAEKRMAAAGRGEDVLRFRGACQEAMREDLVGLIEEHLGRKVEAFSSHNVLEPDVAVELFVLDGSSPGARGEA
jgi:uncharacterized protein YbcI